MNRFHILTLFPEMVMDGLNTSIIGRAIEAGLLEINAVNIRDYSTNKHMKVDDYPYGGWCRACDAARTGLSSI